MKKFDFLIVLVASGILTFGYYATQRFKPEAEISMSSASSEKKKRQRIPSSNKKGLPKKGVKNIINNKKNNAHLEEKNIFQERKEYLSRYIKIKTCLQTQDCNYSNDDPRAYELAVYNDLNQHLLKIDLLDKSQKDKVLKASAREPNGYIKEAVLKQLIKDKIYSEEWRDLILDEYVSYHNSKLIPDVIEYFKLYSSDADKKIIHSRIFKEMASGSPMVANALAEHLKTLLNKESIVFYKAQIPVMPEGPIKDNLSREIKDYELHESAG